MGKINVLGIGPGHKDYCLPIVRKRAHQQDLLIGSQRHLAILENFQGRQFAYSSITELYQVIEENMDVDIGVLVSGDTGFYSLASTLKRKYPTRDVTFTPGISSLQYMFSRMGLSYEKAKLVSMHGRECQISVLLEEYDTLGILTDKKHSPSYIASLVDEDVMVHVGERLSYENERIVSDQAGKIRSMEFESLSVVILERKHER